MWYKCLRTMETNMSNSESRQFRMHPQLLFDVIRRQAGTLGKAVLEGIMNSADAGASRCDITLSDGKLTISDDGKGFKDRGEIERFFETFGQPHDASENKIYGTFRMGRGQLFAFGRNHWVTGQFEMRVDVQGKGLDYDLTTASDKSVKGCQISVELYRKLLPSELQETTREIEKLSKYIAMRVSINGELISVDCSKQKWDHETDEAYVKLSGSAPVLSVYNLGVHVKDYSSHVFGTGGVVVSRKQLKVNFARNDVMVNECPVWRKVKKFVDQKATEQNVRKPVLSEWERKRLCDQISSGDLSPKEYRELRLFTDVTGRHWDLDGISNALYRVNHKVSVAPAGDRRGEKLHMQKVAFIFSDENVERFNCSSTGGFFSLLRKMYKSAKGYDLDCKPVEFKTIAESIKNDLDTLDPKDLTPTERVWQRVIDAHQHVFADALAGRRSTYACSNSRRVVVGSSSSADGWTDGMNYISVAREFLRNCKFDLGGLLKVGRLMLHEYCHGAPDTAEHRHGQEFYQLFHDNSETISEFAIGAFRKLEDVFASENKRLTKIELKHKDAIIRTSGAQDRFLAVAARVSERTPAKAGAKAKPQAEPKGKPESKPVSGANPYRASSDYGILFAVGNAEFHDRDDLIKAVASKTGKTAEQVLNNYRVLANPNHRSNGNRSKVDERDGRVRIVKVA